MADDKNEKNQGRVTPDADHDRIVMASRTPDGKPAQFDPEFIGDKKTAIEAAEVQLTEQKVSAVDQAKRGVVDNTGTDDGSDPDPAVKELQKAHEAAEKAAKSQAASEVDDLHEGLGDKK